jgi:hypothetical protein
VPEDPRSDITHSGTTAHYDVIVIGTGAGGGTFAHRLAPLTAMANALRVGDHVLERLG